MVFGASVISQGVCWWWWVGSWNIGVFCARLCVFGCGDDVDELMGCLCFWSCVAFLLLPVRGDLSSGHISDVARSSYIGVVFDWSVVEFGLYSSLAFFKAHDVCATASIVNYLRIFLSRFLWIVQLWFKTRKFSLFSSSWVGLVYSLVAEF